jgi:L-threonylcarbamoyladenylate synthase
MLDDLMKPDTLPEIYEKALECFWPGPLTILIKKPKCIPDCVSSGQETIAVRMPAHPIARALISCCNTPLAAPSANTSGRPSPTLAEHVYDDLKGRIPFIIDGGPCQSGVESTVLDGLRQVVYFLNNFFRRIIPAVLRPGGVTIEALEAVLGKVQVYKKDFEDKKMEQAPTTPGMKYKHYSPNCSVVLIEAHELSLDTQLKKIEETYKDLSKTHDRIGVLLVNPTTSVYPIQESLGINAKEVAQSLFSKLRKLESLNVSVILVQGIREDNEGLAVMNRLCKAATILI